jgi:hypothetical protein
MSAVESLVNLIHREVTRVMARNTRRTPAVVDSWDPDTYAAKYKLMPDSADQAVITGLISHHTPQTGKGFGWHFAPNIGDHGYLEFHEDDREAAFSSGGTFNDMFKPVRTQAGETQYISKWGHVLYFKDDGSVTIKNGNKQKKAAQQTTSTGSGTNAPANDTKPAKQSAITLTNDGNVTITCANDCIVNAADKIVFTVPKFIINGVTYLGGADAGNQLAMKGTVDTEGNADIGNLSNKAFTK